MKLFGLNFGKDKNETTPPPNAGSEMGAAGDAVFSSLDSELERSDRTTIKDYRKMRDTDATVASLFNVVTLPILAATFGVKADPDDENEEQAEFIRTCLFKQPYLGGMEIPFSLVLEQMLHAVMDGFEVFERVYKVDGDGRLVLRKLALRDATTLKIRVDKNGRYDGVRQQAAFGDRQIDVVIPAAKTFLFTYGKADNAWYGRSAFKSCWHNWDKKQKLEYLDSIAIQNSAIKPKIMTRTENSTINSEEGRSKGLKMLAKLGKLSPAGELPYGFEVKELQGGDNSGINESIERQNSEMARSFLASFILLGTQGSRSVGSYALSADQSDLFMIALKGTMNLVVDHINQYWIADLIDLNYPVGERHYPEFYFDDLTDETKDFLKNIFLKLIEKDAVADDIIGGIEEQIKSRFEIEPVERDFEKTRSTGSIGQLSDNPTPGDSELSGQLSDNPTPGDSELSGQLSDNHGIPVFTDFAKNVKTGEEEGDGSDADKFRREATEWEKKVNWGSIEKQRKKIEAEFEKEATPLLDNFLKELSGSPDKLDNGLPEDYIDAVSKYFKKAYNFGKMAASDEEGKPAPKTKENEANKTQEFVDFVIKDQTESLSTLIKGADEDTELAVAEFSASKFLAAAADWLKQVIDGTKNAIFGHGNTAGRLAAYEKFDEDEDAVYMWSALMENTCAVCEALDGSVYSSKEAHSLKYQPGEVHLNCACEWVRMTGDRKPKPTGLPDGVDELDHIIKTKKDDLKKEGIVKDGETKENALSREKFNDQDNGRTLSEVEDSIRSQNFETMAGFSKKGDKIFDHSDYSVDQVLYPEKLNKLFANSDGSIITHNHPGGSSFSPNDLSLAALINLDELRAVSDSYNYSVKPGVEGWPAPEEIYSELQMCREKWYIIAEVKAEKGEISPGVDVGIWATDEAMKEVAKKYGLYYNRSKI